MAVKRTSDRVVWATDQSGRKQLQMALHERSRFLDTVREAQRSSRRIAYFEGSYFFSRFKTFFDRFEISQGIVGGRNAVIFTGKHALFAPVELTVLDKAERTFGPLPKDYRAFLKAWNGGTLLLREYYRLLPLEEVLELNMWLRNEGIGGGQNKAWRTIRFCDAGDGNYLALDFAEGGRVIWMDNEYDDHKNIALFGVKPEGDSFASWIERVIRKDGSFRDNSLASPTFGHKANAIILA